VIKRTSALGALPLDEARKITIHSYVGHDESVRQPCPLVVKVPCAEPPNRQTAITIPPRVGTDTFPVGDGDIPFHRLGVLPGLTGSGKPPPPPQRLIGRGSLGVAWLADIGLPPTTASNTARWASWTSTALFDANNSRDAGRPIPMAPYHATPPPAWLVRRQGVSPCGGGWVRDIGGRPPSSSLVLPWPHRIVGPSSIHMAGYRTSVKWEFLRTERWCGRPLRSTISGNPVSLCCPRNHFPINSHSPSPSSPITGRLLSLLEPK